MLKRLAGWKKRNVRTFNMGIGYVIIASEEEAAEIVNVVKQQGENAWIIGRVSKGKGGVVFCQN